ncbi:uncharacterized protein [Clytia hemisphaerica]|uniref:Fibrinogen C-terminal domain-containing protein n=1 Tax=Clytia hemisphaerica TaxID=252671 RepID=A0A7M5XCB5_9CNID
MYSSIFLTQMALVYARWYTQEETEGNVGTTTKSNIISARSPIECTLKCQRKMQKSFYVPEKEQCHCMRSWEHDAGSDGVMFEEHDKCTPFQSCKEVKEVCPECESDIYELAIVDGDKKTTKAFCDLTTDGGGWLAVANMTFEDPSDIYPILLQNPSTVSQLQNIQSGHVLLHHDLLRNLFVNHG